MKIKELKNKKSDELLNLLADSRKKLAELKINLASGKVKNVKAVKMLKKDIARILTILNEMKITS
ncbi:MAG TPA: 50S ribosomal protein L29 [Candidatus Paceibacterota bacterium]|nr:50S ribosomal protein L29 [Candidatus Paceibacterota bacterium]HOK97451.1 50S ribosomal protein L29 [Candidatus Paceibacterota bacterium]